MARVATLAVAALLCHVEAAYECPATHKLISNTSKVCDVFECSDATCCEEDDTKCGNSKTVSSCDAGKTMTFGADGKTKADCCTIDQAKCSTLSSCPKGMKKKDGADDEYCFGATCTEDLDGLYVCCVADDTKCGSHVCASGKYSDPTKLDTAGSSDADCCLDETKCTTVTCGKSLTLTEDDGATYTGVLFKDGASTSTDTFNPEEVTTDITKETKCCQPLDTLCYMTGLASKYTCLDGTASKGARTGATKEDCCFELPTCASFTTPEEGGTLSAAEGSNRVNALVATSMSALLFASLS